MKVKAVLASVLLLVFTSALNSQSVRGRKLVRPAAAPPSLPRTADLVTDASYRLVVAGEKAQAFRVEIAPHASTRLNSHPRDYIVISQGPSRATVAGAVSRLEVAMEDGEIQVIQGGWAHRIINESNSPLRWIEIDVLPHLDPEHPVCGLGGRKCTDGHFGKDLKGSYAFSTLFETDTVKLRRLELEPGATLPNYQTEPGCLVVAPSSTLDLSRDIFGQGTTETHLEAGGAAWLKDGCVHSATNVGKNKVEFLSVEVR